MHRSMKKDRDKSTTMAPILYRTAPTTKTTELYVSIMRHYSNTFQDGDRQDAMNIFLGLFQPSRSFKDDMVFVTIEPEKEKGLMSRLWSFVAGQNEEYLVDDRLDTTTMRAVTVDESDIYGDGAARGRSSAIKPSPLAASASASASASSSSSLSAASFASLGDAQARDRSQPGPGHHEFRRGTTATLGEQLASSAAGDWTRDAAKGQTMVAGARRRRRRERENIWDLESDFYLHTSRIDCEAFTRAQPWYGI
jgi:hypothetical protein